MPSVQPVALQGWLLPRSPHLSDRVLTGWRQKAEKSLQTTLQVSIYFNLPPVKRALKMAANVSSVCRRRRKHSPRHWNIFMLNQRKILGSFSSFFFLFVLVAVHTHTRTAAREETEALKSRGRVCIVLAVHSGNVAICTGRPRDNFPCNRQQR